MFSQTIVRQLEWIAIVVVNFQPSRKKKSSKLRAIEIVILNSRMFISFNFNRDFYTGNELMDFYITISIFFLSADFILSHSTSIYCILIEGWKSHRSRSLSNEWEIYGLSVVHDYSFEIYEPNVSTLNSHKQKKRNEIWKKIFCQVLISFHS